MVQKASTNRAKRTLEHARRMRAEKIRRKPKKSAQVLKFAPRRKPAHHSANVTLLVRCDFQTHAVESPIHLPTEAGAVMTRFSLTLFSLMAVGCSTTDYTVNYKVFPPGGMLLENTANGAKEFRRYNPVTGDAVGRYGSKNPEKFTDAKGCYRVTSVTVIWMSGAEVEVTPKLCNGPGEYFIPLIRPQGEGKQIDIDYGQSLALAKQRARAEKERAKLERQAAFEEALLKASTRNRRTNCNSTIIGNQVYTTCD